MKCIKYIFSTSSQPALPYSWRVTKFDIITNIFYGTNKIYN